MMNYWICVASKDHVQRGRAGGFMQANHGKASGLKRMHAGDGVVFYSSKATYPDGEPLQAFTAIGQIADEELYQGEMGPSFQAWRRNVAFRQGTAEVPIRPLISELTFIQDKTHWGYMFRFGLFAIPESDFKLIEHAMLGQVNGD